MSVSRFSRVQKTAAVVPLALLSAAWTASLTTGGPLALTSAGTAAAPTAPGGVLPDGTSVPRTAIEAPASVSSDDDLTGSVGGTPADARQVVATSTTNGIPSAALAAYQRAETVINAADPSCRLPWQLVAAIGRVESDHGRFGGNALDADGLARPGIYGPALDGKGAVSLIRDTDAGQYDNDTRYDRAVGPMQFIPSTWSVVGVDADDDGVRNPQDVDDAALGTAVYLCSGSDDLSTLPGQRAAVYRYNHSQSYVDLVLSIMDNYLDGDFTQVPNGLTNAGYLEREPVDKSDQGDSTTTGSGSTSAQPAAPGSDSGSGSGSTGDGGSGGGSGSDDGGSDDGGSDDPTTPTEVPSLPVPPVTIPPLPETSIEPVDQVLTLAQAIVQCTLEGKVDNLLVSNDPFDRCVKGYTTKP